jgi:hypothetical protein
MKAILFSALVLIGMHVAIPTGPQVLSPVKWSYAAKKISQNEADIYLKATIDDGWHIYSTAQKDGGPIKT